MLIPSPRLPALKGRFPFRLGTTSYILPAAIVPNVRFTGPFVDEIELVFFESRFPDSLPIDKDIEELNRLAAEYDLFYNVHLPTDVLLGHEDRGIRQQACDTILCFYERTLPLEPTMYILHLEKYPTGETKDFNISNWQENLLLSLKNLVERGIERNLISIENLDYPIPWIYPLIKEFRFRICLDIGHLLAQRVELTPYIATYGNEIAMLHLHGIVRRKDHRSLRYISLRDWHIISNFLINYHGGVSMEVFSQEDLASSLERMSSLLASSQDTIADELAGPDFSGIGIEGVNTGQRA